MSYRIKPMQQNDVVWGELRDETSLQEFGEFISLMTVTLNDASVPTIIVIDASELKPTYLNRLSSQNILTFINHPSLKCILVVASNKVVRLMMTVLFNTADGFRLCQTVGEAQAWLQRHSISMA